jgi:hypothetical protein
VAVHVALATRPDLIMAKPGMGVDEGIMQVKYLIDRRNEVASGVHVFIVSLADGNWQIEPKSPEIV